MGGLVSVVIPTYNRAYCLGRTIDSVLAQTYQDFEIVVIDDGSNDDTGKMLERHYGHEKRVRYFYQQNQGVCAARNHGFRVARGDFVALLDSDDVWKPWKVEVEVACLQQYPEVGMVWTDMEAIDPQGRVFDSRYLRTMYSAYRWFRTDDLFTASARLKDFCAAQAAELEGVNVYRGDIFSQIVMGNLVHTSTVMLRRERLARVNGFDERLRHSGEDYDFHLRTCREGPVAFVDAASILYQRGMPDRLTGPSYRIHMAQNFLNTIQPVIARDRARITLPQSMLDKVLAEAHAWVGEEQINLGDHSAARRSLWRSLRLHGWQGRVWFLFASSMLPVGLRRALRNFGRRVRGIEIIHKAAETGGKGV
jgi:GT2 family glycosyltransferase